MLSTRAAVRVGVLLLPLALAACGPAPEPLAMSPDARRYDTAQLLRGEQLYGQYCARCHGAGASGDPDWRRRGADKRFPPPPLNGTAHAWHHPLAQLRAMIKNGGPAGQSNMPAWGQVLDDRQIDDVIAWFQALWPDEIYAAWYDAQQRAAQR